MKISAFKEAALAKFIRDWTGELPAPGFDTLNMVGETCQVTINHKTSSRGNPYPVISSIAPLLDPAMAPGFDELEIPGGSRSGIDVKATASTEQKMLMTKIHPSKSWDIITIKMVGPTSMWGLLRP